MQNPQFKLFNTNNLWVDLRAIQRLVEDPLSERLLLKEFTAGQIVVVDIDNEIEDETDSKIIFKAVE